MNTSALTNGLRLVHPGEVLREDDLKPLGLSANAIAQALKLPPCAWRTTSGAKCVSG